MSQFGMQPDSVPPGKRETLKAILESVARVRRLFPYGGFQGLRTAEIQILLALEAGGEGSPPDLAERLNLDRTSLSDPIVKLAAQGLVAVELGVGDRRHRMIQLTPRGSELVDSYLHAHKGDL